MNFLKSCYLTVLCEDGVSITDSWTLQYLNPTGRYCLENINYPDAGEA